MGRIQVIPGPVTEIYDVSHNPAAVAVLAAYLLETAISGKTYAVFSMLGDKDITESVKGISEQIDFWYVAPLTTARFATQEQLAQAFQQASVQNVTFFPFIQTAYEQVAATAKEGDRIVIFGSFHTVADVLAGKP